jgi:hypothetical protein
MELVSNGPGARIWKLSNGEHVEQRPMLYMRSFEMSATLYDSFPEVAQQATETAIEFAWRSVRELGETFTEFTLHTSRFTVTPLLLDDDDAPILDKDGETIPDPEGVPFEVVRVECECGYWPTIEEVS